MIYEAAWSEKQVILQNIKIIGIFKIKEKWRIITIYPKNIFKLQTTSDEKYWKTNKRMDLANEQFKWNRTMYASLSTDWQHKISRTTIMKHHQACICEIQCIQQGIYLSTLVAVLDRWNYEILHQNILSKRTSY